jgi:hypothetical protein
MDHREGLVCDVAADLIGAGSVPFDTILQRCLAETPLDDLARDEGVAPADLLDDLLTVDARFWFVGDEVIRLDLLLDSVVLTHRITETEIVEGAIAMWPDLDLLDFDHPVLTTADGTPLEVHFFDEAVFTGPPGWFGSVQPGAMYAFTRRGGALTIRPVTEMGDGALEVELMAASYLRYTTGEEGAATDTIMVVLDAIVSDERSFRSPVPPIGELLASVGLENRGELVGPAGSDFTRRPIDEADTSVPGHLVDRYRMHACCIEAFELVAEAFVGAGDADGREVAKALGHGPVVLAFIDWVGDREGLDEPDIGEFADELVDAGRHGAASALTLRAAHRRASGDILAAEADLEKAHLADPEFAPAALHLAELCIIRGDYSRAGSILRRSATEASPLMSMVERMTSHAGVAVGRNEPCPCGSGRKYKACHLGKPPIEPREMVWALIAKVMMVITNPQGEQGYVRLALLAAGDDPDLFEQMLDEPLVRDLAMFDDGGLTDCLHEVGALLPEAERDTLELWADIPLGLWEVTETDGTSALTVFDTRTAERITVTDRSLAGSAEVDMLLLARFLPYADRWWTSPSVVPIDLRIRDHAIELLDSEPSAEELAMWYGSLFLPPTVTNREGEAMSIATAVLVPTTDWREVVATLDRLYEPQESDIWHELHAIADDERVLRASLRRDGDALVVDANSAERLDRVIDALAGVTRVDHRRVDVADSPEMLAEAMTRGAPAVDPDAPEVTEEVIREITEQMEQRWLTESIPALGGLTPRQAADDPTRRADLVALLASFPKPQPPLMTMDPDRLRNELGL